VHLIIDAGNTRIKVAQYQTQRAIDIHFFDDQKSFDNFVKKFEKTLPCISSQTGNWDLSLLSQHFDQYFSLNAETPLPFEILYKSPQTLGNDRRALAAAAFKTFPQQASLILDAGTCLTVDYIDADGNYHGGAISLGLQMRFKALQHFTAALPKINWEGEEFPKLIGDSTENSILTGVVQGYVSEINNWITQYQEQFGDMKLVLCGGDATLLLRWLKNDIFAPSNFLLNGLDYILDYNLQQK
jgi:type III pantothenate kinase